MSELYIVIELSKVRNLEVVGSYNLIVYKQNSPRKFKEAEEALDGSKALILSKRYLSIKLSIQKS